MVATCYTLRPTPESGWITFFELGRSVNSPGFFLILGPATPPGGRPEPEARQEAQGVARAVVTAWKNRAGTDPAEWLAGARRLVARAGRPMEFGAVVLRGEEVHFLCEGRVRLFPLTASARHRWEHEPVTPGERARRRVEVGDRFFFGRLPEELGRGLPSADALEGVERAGRHDGALILTFLPAAGATERLEAVAAPEPPVPSARIEAVEEPAPRFVEPAPPEPPTLPPLETIPRLPPTRTELAEPPEPPLPPRPPLEIVSSPVDEEMPRRRGAASRWPLAAVAVSVVGLVVYFAWLRPKSPVLAVPVATQNEAATVQPADTVDAVPSGTASGHDSSGVAWEARLGGAVTGTPLVLHDRIVATARDGTITALDRHDGHPLWSLDADKGFGGGAVGDDSIGCAAGFDGIVRLFSPADGREVARLDTGSRIASPPVRTTEGSYVAGAYDRTLYSLDPRSRRPGWKTRLGGILWASPGVGRKYLFAPGLDGVVTAVNSKWGSILWRFKAGSEIYSSPATNDTVVVFGCEDGSIYAITADEGRLLWRTPVGHPVSGGALIAAGLALAGDDGGMLHALDLRTGRERWHYDAGGAIKSRPVIDSGALLVTTHGGSVHAIEFPSGTPIGRYPIGSPIAASPAISGDSLFVGTHDGRVVAIRLR